MGLLNKLEGVRTLHNRYFALRHGKSQANELGIIVSHPENGENGYGLVDEGRVQVYESVKKALEGGVLGQHVVVASSPFKRARETGLIAQALIKTPHFRIENALRERHFGTLEKTGNQNYAMVNGLDAENADHTEHGVESVHAVLERTTGLILDLEEEYSGQSFLLASHGDTLQILQTGFEKIPGEHHRKLAHLNNGEIRQLHLKL